MSTFWPGCTFARSTSACLAVSATRGTEAASATDRARGLDWWARLRWFGSRRGLPAHAAQGVDAVAAHRGQDGAAYAIARVRVLPGAHALELVLGPPQLGGAVELLDAEGLELECGLRGGRVPFEGGGESGF